jgi:hypothetical protein
LTTFAIWPILDMDLNEWSEPVEEEDVNQDDSNDIDESIVYCRVDEKVTCLYEKLKDAVYHMYENELLKHLTLDDVSLLLFTPDYLEYARSTVEQPNGV